MSRYFLVFLICLCSILGGCGGTQTVTRTNAPVPEQIKSAAFSPLAGNSPEVDGYISDALLMQGVETNPAVAAGIRKNADSDAVLTYTDVWRWDMAMYLQSITISLYDAKTGQLLVSGRWRDSFLHAFHRGESITKELLAEMFGKLNPRAD
ncbi:MAG: hypothetical protein HGA71_06450 [Azonexaceae bacterium]|nr:hypothetical protein [Azonexaceae bacterium]